jgi:hypothetical protein
MLMVNSAEATWLVNSQWAVGSVHWLRLVQELSCGSAQADISPEFDYVSM